MILMYFLNGFDLILNVFDLKLMVKNMMILSCFGEGLATQKRELRTVSRGVPGKSEKNTNKHGNSRGVFRGQPVILTSF